MFYVENTAGVQQLTRGARMTIKAFKTADKMYDFLNTNFNHTKWQESKRGLPSGNYVSIGGRYVNVKSIDPSALAHF